MRRSGIFGIVVGVSLLAGQAAFGQALNNSRGPAEIPPASFTGSQYVDSKGCVFIRAGIGGNVKWIPRVSRDRKVICNARPSRVAAAPRATAPVRVTPVPRVTTAARTATAPQATRVIRKAPVVAAPTPRRVVRQVAPVYQQPSRQVTVTRGQPNFANNCNGRSANSQGYSSSNGVRCGSQQWHPSQSRRVVQGGTQYAQPNAIVAAPRQQARNYSNKTTYPNRPAWLGGVVDDRRANVVTAAPQGYRPVWTDGRINERRGVQYGGQAQPNGSTWVPIQPRYSSRTVTPAAPARAVSAPRVSSSHRYVQVGTYSVASNAQRAARRLNGMGLPAKIGSARGYQVVLVGPYSSANSLRSALSSARRAGFGDAFTRR